MYRLPRLEPTVELRRIALLTSGGAAPGVNAAIRALVRSALVEGIDVLGVNRGFAGLVKGEVRPLTSASVANILQRGGTVLKSGRDDSFTDPAVRWQAVETLREMGVDALVVIGGRGTLTAAHLMAGETDFPVLGLPGTIDNDLWGTDDTIGFDTAVNTALDAIDRIRDTANSHDRLFLVEVMGRHSGFIAAQAGIAGGAELILVPDRPIELEAVCQRLERSDPAERISSHIILVAEGRKSGRTQRLGQALAERGFDPRVCILGDTQRGGAPTGHDRVLASCLGAMAVDSLRAGLSNRMLGVQQQEIVTVPLVEVLQGRKTLDDSMLALARRLQE